MPKISIIVPFLNSAETLRFCLSSLAGQTYKNCEVIMVDNGSTDDSSTIAKGFANKDKRFFYVIEPTRGRGRARNTGLDHASGEIIAMLDAGSVATPDWLEKLTISIRGGEAVAVSGPTRDLSGTIWSRIAQEMDDRFYRRHIKGENIEELNTDNFAIKTELLAKYRFDDNLESLEDYDLYLRTKDDFKIKATPEVKIGHYQRTNLIETIKRKFECGFWLAEVKEKHREKLNGHTDQNLKSISLQNLVALPFWFIILMFKESATVFVYLLVTESAWRTGALASFISRIMKK